MAHLLGQLTGGMSRQRFETCQVRFLESHNPAWTQMMCQLVQDHSRGAQIHQDEPANNGIKLAIKLHAFDVPYQERHIRQSCLINARALSRIVGLLSTPTTVPLGPIMSARSRATSPAPLPTSNTFIPAMIPACSKSLRVRGFSTWACSRNRRVSSCVRPIV